jgi:polyphenol oxidase
MSGAILFSEKLDRAGVNHGFSTRAAGDVLGSLKGWEKETGMSSETVVWLNQVHETDVLVVDQPASICASDRDLRYDASVTDRQDVVLSVRVADCVPVLLYSENPRAIGVVHAGWRGTLNGAVTSAVNKLQEIYACKPADMIAAIGPSIQPCCYEVGDDVYRPFTERFGSEAVSVLGTRKFVHLAVANRIWLVECGLSDERIEVMDFCTCCRKETFFSYRREGANAGRQLAYISLAPKP